MSHKLLWSALLVLWLMPAVFAGEAALPLGKQPCETLTNATILIIRHAEKPDHGPELAPAGSQRAQAYADYFQHFQVDGHPLKLNHLFCTADSAGSRRPRRTLEALSQALKLPLDGRFPNKNALALAQEIRTHFHGQNLLICWHHGEIPVLLAGLGADPQAVLPEGVWPDEVFDWLIELRFDAAGRLLAAQRLPEHLMPGDEAPSKQP